MRVLSLHRCHFCNFHSIKFCDPAFSYCSFHSLAVIDCTLSGFTFDDSMWFARNFALVLGTTCITTISARVYTDIESISQFIAQLDLSQETGSRVAEILDGHDANSISNLAPEEKASLACQINAIANDGTFYTSTPASTGYQDVIQAYW